VIGWRNSLGKSPKGGADGHEGNNGWEKISEKLWKPKIEKEKGHREGGKKKKLKGKKKKENETSHPQEKKPSRAKIKRLMTGS